MWNEIYTGHCVQKLEGMCAGTQRVIICYLLTKLASDLLQTFCHIHVPTSWMEFYQRTTSRSLSELITKPGLQRWGQLLGHRTYKREVQENSGISSQPASVLVAFFVCHMLGFGVIKPYNEMSFWSSLEAKHQLKYICSVLSLGCWDVTYSRWLTELCHGDRAFNCPAPQVLLYPAREPHTYLQVTQKVQL